MFTPGDDPRITIGFGNGKQVTFTSDGSVEFSGEYEPKEAALAFWEAFAYYNPARLLRQELDDLKQQIKQRQIK